MFGVGGGVNNKGLQTCKGIRIRHFRRVCIWSYILHKCLNNNLGRVLILQSILNSDGI